MSDKIKYEPVCVISVCEGYCCEHISREVMIPLKVYGLKFEPNNDDGFRCLSHNKKTFLCDIQDKKPSYCSLFYCPSAIRGFMRILLDSMDKSK